MKCKDVRRQLGTADFRGWNAEALPRGIQEHLARCPECRMWLQRTRMCSEVMRAQAQAEPSEAFTNGVMARIAAENTQPRSATWLDRVHGVLRPIESPLPVYQIAAACLLLIAVVVAGAAHMGVMQNPGHPAVDGGVIVADGATMPGSVIARGASQPGIVTVGGTDMANGAAISDLVLRHENYEMSKPLGTDAGVLLISRASY